MKGLFRHATLAHFFSSDMRHLSQNLLNTDIQNFGLNVSRRMKKWANVVCQNNPFMGPCRKKCMILKRNYIGST